MNINNKMSNNFDHENNSINDKIKIIILTTVLAPYRVDLFNSISENNQIDLKVYFEQTNDSVRNKKWYSNDIHFEAHFLQKSNKSLKKIKFDFLKILKKEKCDLVIFYEPSTITASISINYCINHKIKYLLNCDGAILKNKELIIKKSIKTRNIKHANGLISNGSSAKNYYLNYGASEKQIFNHHFSSLHTEEVLNEVLADNKKTKMKNKLKLKNKHVIISVGSFIHRKGYDLLLESIKKFNSLHNDYNDYYFLIIGSGEERDQYIQYIKDNLLSNVCVKNFMSKRELLDYYDVADTFVLLTRYEIWGLVIHEAMARGLPVMSTNMCNAAIELIKDNNYGSIININGPKETIIDSICNEIPRLVNSSYANKFKIIKEAQKYTIEISAAEHINIILKVVDKK